MVFSCFALPFLLPILFNNQKKHMATLDYKYQTSENKITINSNGKSKVYVGKEAKEQLTKILKIEIEQLKDQIAELNDYYTNPDNIDKPNWHQIKRDHDCKVLKLVARESRLNNNTRFYESDPGSEPVQSGIVFFKLEEEEAQE